MGAVTELGDLRIMAANGRQSPGEIGDATAALRDLIAAAIADAKREGAEQMRAEAAKIARALPLYYGSGDDGADESLAQAIEDLPPPTGPRQAVRLTDGQIEDALCRPTASSSWLLGSARAIEAAVLAANGLEVRRG
jgi:hypothetical protein